MKYYVYSITEKWIARSSCTQKTITVWKVNNNRLKFLFTRKDTFVDDYQMFIKSMEIVGAGKENYEPLHRYDKLPAKAFERNAVGGWKYHPYDLEQMGIAVVQQI